MSADYPIELLGARWATDGACLVREGTELPPSDGIEDLFRWRDWLTSAELGKREHCLRSAGQAVPKDVEVHQRFSRLIQEAERIDCVPHLEMWVIRCWQGARIVALVCPVREHVDLSVRVSKLRRGRP